jgi:hypothetical protein
VSALMDLSNNKIGEHTGEKSHFICDFWCFSVAICSGFTFLLSYQSMSLQDIPIDPLGLKVFFIFQKID